MPRDLMREEEFESRWEAAPAVAVVIAMQLLLALVSRGEHWTLWVFPWWVWIVPVGLELLLLVPLAWHRPRRRLEQLGRRRTVAIALLALVSASNALLLLAVIASLVRGDENSGAQLSVAKGQTTSNLAQRKRHRTLCYPALPFNHLILTSTAETHLRSQSLLANSTMPLLTVRKATKTFGGVAAVKDVSLTVEEGEILGIMGPNGSGKTTLFNLVSGVFYPDSGDIFFQDERTNKLLPHQLCHRGLARTFQLVRPFLGLTAEENVAGRDPPWRRAPALG